MYPTLLDLSEYGLDFVSLPSYFTMLMTGYLLNVLLSIREGKRMGIDPGQILLASENSYAMRNAGTGVASLPTIPPPVA